jgi:hypothetical protein
MVQMDDIILSRIYPKSRRPPGIPVENPWPATHYKFPGDEAAGSPGEEPVKHHLFLDTSIYNMMKDVL